MSESPFSPRNNSLRIKKIDRSHMLNCQSSSASSSTPKVFKTRTNNKITKPDLLISGRDNRQSVKTGTSLVNGKFKIKQ